MGFGKEAFEAGVKGIKTMAPAVKRFVKENLSEVNADIFSDMAKHNQPAFNDMYQKIDTITKTQDQVLREDLGFTVLKDFDKIKADRQRLKTAREVQNTLNKAVGSETANITPKNTSGSLGRSKAHKAWKGTDKVGPLSLIAGTPASIIKKEPHNADKAMAWARDMYAYAQQGKSGNKAQPLRGAPRYVAEDGTLYKPKTLTGAGKGYQLKFPSLDLLKGYDDLRKLREAPWRKQEVVDQLQKILLSKGKEDKLDDLLKLMVKEYHKKLKGIKAAGQTKGHFISLEKGGFDIAENFGPQRGKSIKNPKTGEWEMGNYAEGAGSSIPEGVSVPTTWEEYVDLKLPLLK